MRASLFVDHQSIADRVGPHRPEIRSFKGVSIQRRSHEVILAKIDNRFLPVRIRDGVAWLLRPYL